MENRIELAISKQTTEIASGLRDMQKQINEQTWRIIGAVGVIVGLTLTAAKLFL